MNKIGGDVMRLFLFLILSLTLLTPAYAAEYLAGNIVKVQSGDTVYSDIFAGSRYVDVHGVVKGDIYAGCEVLTVEGRIDEDLLVGCRNLEIRGSVKDGVVAFAQTIVIDGVIGGDVLAFGGSVRLTERAILKGNLFVGTGELWLDGARIAGDINGGAGKIYLNGQISGQVNLEAEHVNFGTNYQANKGTKLTLKSELNQKNLDYVPANLEVIVKKPRRFYQSIFFYWKFLALLVLGIIIISLFKNVSRDLLAHGSEKPLRDLGVGFLIVVVTPIILVILMLFILTIPLGLILLAAYLVLLCLAIIYTAIFSGDYILKLLKSDGKKSLFWPLLLGLLILIFIVQLPLLGFFFNLAIFSFGSGGLIVYIWKLTKPAESTTA
jgi:cytoskeletal protein CcmA (bactofilin family)